MDDYDNDLHAFAAEGFTGAHFDNVSGSTRYHTLGDNLASADPRALQEEGNTMVTVVRRFGSLPISEAKAEDEVFFALFGGRIVHYPISQP